MEAIWPIFKIHHQRSRYIYDLFDKRKAISKELYELYDWCLKNKVADANLIAKWKKQGYENLCCLRCIQTRDTNFATTAMTIVGDIVVDLIKVAAEKKVLDEKELLRQRALVMLNDAKEEQEHNRRRRAATASAMQQQDASKGNNNSNSQGQKASQLKRCRNSSQINIFSLLLLFSNTAS